MNFFIEDPDPVTPSDILDTVIVRPMLIIDDTVLFPHILTPLLVSQNNALHAIEAAHSSDGDLIVVTQHTEVENPTPNDVYSIGVRASVVRHLHMPDGTMNVLLQGYERVEVLDWLQDSPYPIVRVQRLFEEAEEPTDTDNSLAVEAQIRAVLALFEKCTKLHPRIPEDAFIAASNINDPGWLADLIASVLEITIEQRQEILEIIEPLSRLQRLAVILARELDVLELENRIQNQVQQEVDRSQRDYFLREQIRVIQTELGENDSNQAELNELKQRLESLNLPEEARRKAEKELKRLAEIPPMAPEIGIIRTYIDWILELPWTERTPDNLDLNHAEQVLDKNHYGLPRVKERILEYMAVRARTGHQSKLRSPILCFMGPPGTGKTSLGQSIAQAMGRKFARLSLGGVRDEAEIRGHRRTYIGAMPGRIIQTMKRVGTTNPLMMLDEVDKLGMDYRGDPTAALLEVLDPEQNYTFSDHYLDLPYDLSKVLFITTANITDTIPPAMLDRMEVIEFSGYIDEEKIAIARQFLIPRHLEEHGLTAKEINFSTGILQTIIRSYTYESGVRNLDREIGRICRKIVRRLVQNKRTAPAITEQTLSTYLGPPVFTDTILDEDNSVGVATGLAWTPAGGDVLSIEVSLCEGKGSLTLTGQLGDVMQESVQAGLSYIKAHAADYQISPSRFETTDIHLHVPEGATPKDGPSAGITMTVALISAFSERKVNRRVAMTGEITLRGKVLGVGGLRAKAMAAHRVGLTTMIIPKQNHKDLVEIPQKIRNHLTFIEVDTLEDVLKVALL